jgi:hypothetical protein
VDKNIQIDLSAEKPGPRAIVDDLPREAITFAGELPLVGGKLAMKARLDPGSALSRLAAAVSLASTGCACAITLSLIGAPMWAAAGHRSGRRSSTSAFLVCARAVTTAGSIGSTTAGDRGIRIVTGGGGTGHARTSAELGYGKCPRVILPRSKVRTFSCTLRSFRFGIPRSACKPEEYRVAGATPKNGHMEQRCPISTPYLFPGERAQLALPEIASKWLFPAIRFW